MLALPRHVGKIKREWQSAPASCVVGGQTRREPGFAEHEEQNPGRKAGVLLLAHPGGCYFVDAARTASATQHPPALLKEDHLLGQRGAIDLQATEVGPRRRGPAGITTTVPRNGVDTPLVRHGIQELPNQAAREVVDP